MLLVDPALDTALFAPPTCYYTTSGRFPCGKFCIDPASRLLKSGYVGILLRPSLLCNKNNVSCYSLRDVPTLFVSHYMFGGQ